MNLRASGRWWAAALAPLALVTTGCMMGADIGVREQAEWVQTYDWAPGGELSIDNVNGSIQVKSWDQPKIEVRAEKVARAGSSEKARAILATIEITATVRPGRINIETKLPVGTGGGMLSMLLGGAGSTQVKYEVKAPGGAIVGVQTQNGAVYVSGIHGGVRAETTNGGIDGDDLRGKVIARTTNGHVRVAVKAVAGDGIELKTVNGGISLTLPATARADVSARVVNGSIDLRDVSLEASGNVSRRRVDGRMNGGGPRVELETTNGGIKVNGTR